MPEREELEINLKTTGDTSGADKVRASLEAVNNQVRNANRERPLTQQQAAAQGITTASNAELSRSFLTQRDLERRRIEAEAEDLRSRVQPVFSSARGAMEEGAARANAATTEQGVYATQTPLGPITRQIQDARVQQREKERIDKEYYSNLTKERQNSEKEELATQNRLYIAHGKQLNDYIKSYRQAQKEQRVTPEGPQGPGGPPVPPNIRDLLGDGNAGGGGGGGSRGGIFDRNTTSVIRFGAALAGLGVGLSIYYFAGRLLHDAIAGIVSEENNAVQATINLNAAFGNSAKVYDGFIKTVSTGGTGAGLFRTSDVQQSITSLKSLQDNFHLSDEQVKTLIADAAKLADIRGIPLQEATSALSQALSGSSTAADKLGLSLSQVQIASQYANGQFATTFQLLSPMEQASATLAVATQQVGEQFTQVAGKVDPLQQAVRNLNAQWEALNKTLGNGALSVAAAGINALATSLEKINGLIQKSVSTIEALPPWAQEALKLGALVGAGPLGPIAAVTAAGSDAFAAVNRARSQRTQQAVPETPGPGAAPGSVLSIVANQQSAQALARIQDLKEANDSLARSAEAAAKAEAQTFAQLAQAAPSITQQISTLGGSVSNISTLTAAEKGALAVRQAEIGALHQKQVAELTATAATYGEIPAVKALIGVYNDLVNAQSDVNRLQQEGIQLQAALAQAQLNALAQTRAAQDIDLRQQRDRLIATDRLVSAQQRGAARRDLRQAAILAPDVQLAAFNASLPAVAAQRDVERNQLLTRVAQATEAQAQQVVDIRVSVNGAQVATNAS